MAATAMAFLTAATSAARTSRAAYPPATARRTRFAGWSPSRMLRPDVYLDMVLHQLIGGMAARRFPLSRRRRPDAERPRGHESRMLSRVPPATGRKTPCPCRPMISSSAARRSTRTAIRPGTLSRTRSTTATGCFAPPDADGMRFDDTKGTWAPFVSQFMRSRAMADKFFYSEYFDGNPDKLNWWATSPPMSSRSLVEDFTLHWALQAACDGGNASALNGAGYAARNPFLTCTFVDNPDTDTFRRGDHQLEAAGLRVYPDHRGLSVRLWQRLLPFQRLARRLWAETMDRQPDLDPRNARRGPDGDALSRRQGHRAEPHRWAGTADRAELRHLERPHDHLRHRASGPDVDLHDYTGRHPDIRTDGDGRATFTIPSNAYQNGQCYLCFSRAGFDQPMRVAAAPRLRCSSARPIWTSPRVAR